MPTAFRSVTRIQDQDDVTGTYADGQVPTFNGAAFEPRTALAIPLHVATRDNTTEQLLVVHTMDNDTFPGGSPAPDYAPVQLLCEYKATNASLDPWDATYLGLQSRLVYGTDAIAPRGTVHAMTATVDVVGSATRDNEMGGLMGWMRAGRTGHEVSCGLVFLDLTVHGGIGGAQLKYQNVASFFSNTYTSNPPNDAPSIGMVCSTYPGKGAGTELGHDALTTYPMDIGCLVSGRSGVPGVAAGVGWTTAYQAGGYGGWVTSAQGSSIGTGFYARDCSINGVLLEYPLGTTGNAIQIGYEPTGWTGHWDWLLKCNASGAQVVTPQTGAILLPGVADSRSQIRWGLGGYDPQLYRSDGVNAILTLRGALIIDRQDGNAQDGIVLRMGRSDAAIGKVGHTLVNDQGQMQTYVAGAPADGLDLSAAGDTCYAATTAKSILWGFGTATRLRLTTYPDAQLQVGGSLKADGPFAEDTTTPGTYVGKKLADSPRVMFANGTAAQNWQIDNLTGTFRWFLPGVVHMSLTSTLLDLPGGKPVQFAAMTAPAAPASGKALIYSRISDGHMCAKGSDGVEHDLVTGAAATAVQGSKTWDPPSVANREGATTTVTVTGAALGGLAVASWSVALPDGVDLTAKVTAADTVTVTLWNLSGSTQDIASGTLRAMVWAGS